MRHAVITGVLAAGLMVLTGGAGFAQQAPKPDPKSPNYQATGEQEKSYIFPGTTESIGYHIYVPKKWTKTTRLPLVIVTHGASQADVAPFQRPIAMPTLAQTAEARGYIVAA
ncbi:MAG TPA: hypothetical protein VG871_22110, partial [Vicinamibacterales bacterium]|nr:hypothetical protein [Vicinamibacterales bacterium]